MPLSIGDKTIGVRKNNEGGQDKAVIVAMTGDADSKSVAEILACNPLGRGMLPFLMPSGFFYC